MFKDCWIDLETTGLDETKHGITQIAVIIDIGGVEEEELLLYVKPFPGDLISKDALEKQNVTVEELREYPSAEEGYNKLIKIFKRYVNPYDKKDKFYFLGYNSPFDNKFLRAWFTKMNDNYFGSWFWNPPLDIMDRSMFYLKNVRFEMEDFQLFTVAEKLGVDLKNLNAHNALDDIRVTKLMYDIIKHKDQ